MKILVDDMPKDKEGCPWLVYEYSLVIIDILKNAENYVNNLLTNIASGVILTVQN